VSSIESERSRFRLLRDGIRDPFRHFAVEETILRGVDESTSPPTLRLRQVQPSVWIGIYQVPEEDVDLDYCREHRLPVVRRYNPGGAVYQDEGSFCYSLFFRHRELFDRLRITNPMELYPLLDQAVIDTCAEYGVEAVHSPVNDVTIHGRKVYGSAQVEWYEAFVHNGTFLVSTNRDAMEHALRPSKLKFADKGFTNIRDRVINLSEAAGHPIPVQEVMERLAGQIAHRLDIDLAPGSLLPQETIQAEELWGKKYVRPDWTFRHQPSYTSILSTKAPSGVITLEATLDGSILQQVNVKGDFLLVRQEDLRVLLEQMKGLTPATAATLAQRSPLPKDVRESLAKLLQDLVESFQ
jgi:lipoate-protein ligase A